MRQNKQLLATHEYLNRNVGVFKCFKLYPSPFSECELQNWLRMSSVTKTKFCRKLLLKLLPVEIHSFEDNYSFWYAVLLVSGLLGRFSSKGRSLTRDAALSVVVRHSSNILLFETSPDLTPCFCFPAILPTVRISFKKISTERYFGLRD